MERDQNLSTEQDIREAAALMKELLSQKPEKLKATAKPTGDRALSQQARRLREAGASS